jgi:endonuclease-3
MADARKTLMELKRAYPGARYYLDFTSPLELVVATILSAQVRDEVVNASTPALFARYKTAEAYAKAGPEDILRHISRITFAGNKAKHIVKACALLAEKHRGQVPRTMAELVELPGVGRKTANAILQNAFGIVDGVVVDTHVIRVAGRLGWTRHQDPEKIEQDLMRLFPKEEWKAIPHLLKSHGRAVCTAPKPKCPGCPIRRLCPSFAAFYPEEASGKAGATG